jgi:hypothetical protein
VRGGDRLRGRRDAGRRPAMIDARACRPCPAMTRTATSTPARWRRADAGPARGRLHHAPRPAVRPSNITLRDRVESGQISGPHHPSGVLRLNQHA